MEVRRATFEVHHLVAGVVGEHVARVVVGGRQGDPVESGGLQAVQDQIDSLVVQVLGEQVDRRAPSGRHVRSRPARRS
jgi:hypothetical protein